MGALHFLHHAVNAGFSAVSAALEKKKKKNHVCGGGQEKGGGSQRAGARQKKSCAWGSRDIHWPGKDPGTRRKKLDRYRDEYVQFEGKCQIVRNDQPEFGANYVCIAEKREYVRKGHREKAGKPTYWNGKQP